MTAAVRRTFGAHLGKNGVPPGTAHAALRRPYLDLTMNVYPDLSLLGVAGTVEVLPELVLDDLVPLGAEQAAQ